MWATVRYQPPRHSAQGTEPGYWVGTEARCVDSLGRRDHPCHRDLDSACFAATPLTTPAPPRPPAHAVAAATPAAAQVVESSGPLVSA